MSKTFEELGYKQIANKNTNIVVAFRNENDDQIQIDIINGAYTKRSLPYSLVDFNGDLYTPDLSYPPITKEEQAAIDKYIEDITLTPLQALEKVFGYDSLYQEKSYNKTDLKKSFPKEYSILNKALKEQNHEN